MLWLAGLHLVGAKARPSRALKVLHFSGIVERVVLCKLLDKGPKFRQQVTAVGVRSLTYHR